MELYEATHLHIQNIAKFEGLRICFNFIVYSFSYTAYNSFGFFENLFGLYFTSYLGNVLYCLRYEAKSILKNLSQNNLEINFKQLLKRQDMFKDKTVVVTGGANGIGKCIAEEFRANGARVYIIDKEQGNHFVGDISKQQVLEEFVSHILQKESKVDIIVNNALPIMKGIDQCTYEEFQYALNVGITAPFYLVKLLMPHLAEGASIINISSSRDRMSQPQTESYTAAKGGIAALTHALAISLAGRARVNSISPGWIDTAYTVYEGADATQQPAGRVGNPMDIANMVLFLCSDKATFITAENICIDGGMTKQMIYHADHGWKLEL